MASKLCRLRLFLFVVVLIASALGNEETDQQLDQTLSDDDVENTQNSLHSDESVVEVASENGNTTLEVSIIEATPTNGSLVNETATANTTSTIIKRFSCLLDENIQGTSTFQIVNGTVLLASLKQNQNVTSRNQPATCHLVLFFAPWCPFSVQAAPHLNALPRGFPMLNFLAIDAHLHNSLSTMQGVMAIPSLFLFHNGKAAARYNETEYKVDLFASFITRYTGISPVGVLNRTSADYVGPLPTSVVEVTDPWLLLAWSVVFLSLIYWFTRSNLFWTLMENIRNTWREAEAQHQHAD